jgi:hypothetical protein
VGASVATGASSVGAAVPHAVRIIDAMSNRDKTYKSFFMVRFLLKLGFEIDDSQN